MGSHEKRMVYDLAIIGAGVNGAGIARDAAGRGLSVLLCDKGDIGGATSAASTKLIHGGLRYLEHYEFRLVREALREREVLWQIAPHIIRPLRFTLPHQPSLRPAWMIQLGLFLYDHLGHRQRLPGSRRISLRHHPVGEPLRETYSTGFCYSDCWVEDNRLVVLNAKDAAERGASVRPQTACVQAQRKGSLWALTLDHRGQRETVSARALVNASGPWVNQTLGQTLDQPPALPVRMVKGSHIVVPRLFDHQHAYIFQHHDGRIVFAIPFEQDFTLIGTTDQDFHGDPAQASASEQETAYLCDLVSRYFRQPVDPASVVWSYAGVRPLIEAEGEAAKASRDYSLHLDAPTDQAPLLSIYGGKITTYRKLAEAALDRLALTAQGHAAGWTGKTALPGGDIALDQWDEWFASCQARWPWLPEPLLQRLTRTYGSRIEVLIGQAKRLNHLGGHFGADLYQAELRYLRDHEWTRDAQAALWRRTKLGLRLSAQERQAVEAWFTGGDRLG
jgi:glycerol-3-phosphate dehydrogenase